MLGMFVPGPIELIIIGVIALIPVAVVFAVVAASRKGSSRNPNLGACPDCGRYISIRANTCPHCGGPVKSE